MREWFEPPVQIEADGKPIDHGAAGGHCGPTLHDLDGDGLRDLVVGDGGGNFTVYRNVGTTQQPRFARGLPLMAGGEVAHVPVWNWTGSSPRFVDFDGDGIVDLMSGGYDPGTFCLFPGRDDSDAGCRFDKVRALFGTDEDPFKRESDPFRKIELRGSCVDSVDWDDDGDLDLVCGAFDGELCVFVNDGTRTTPSYFPTPARIKLADGSPAHVPSEQSAVVAADWDGDGLFDLVSGSGSGAVVWFRNIGRRRRPLLLPPETLVPATKGNGWGVWLEPGATPRPGVCSRIDVVDSNRDGKLDLLVGDYCTTLSPRTNLTEEQKRAVASLHLQEQTAAAEFEKLEKKMFSELATYSATFPPDQIKNREVQEKIGKRREELEKELDYTTALRRSVELWDELSNFMQTLPGKPDSTEPEFHPYPEVHQPHGWVWLYTRK